MTRTILVLGTNAGQADLIRHMKTRGWRVIGCSQRRGEVGQRFCDAVEHVDIVDIDALEAAARSHAVDLVYSVSSDVAMKSVVALSERMGLPHFFNSDFVELLDDKAKLRSFLVEHELGAVSFRLVTSIAEAAGWDRFPCMVKPTDGQGQRGVARLDGPRGFDDAVTRAAKLARSGKVIIEEFLSGVEISCNVLICGGEVRMKVLSERLVHDGEAFGAPIGHLIPPKHVSSADQEAAMALVDDILAALKVEAGVLYFQMIVTQDGPRVVEIAPRLDGCHMWRLIEACCGVDLIEMTMNCLMGEGAGPVIPAREVGEVDMELIFQQLPSGEPFSAAVFPPPADAIYHEYRYADGEAVNPVNGVLEVVGYYVRETP